MIFRIIRLFSLVRGIQSKDKKRINSEKFQFIVTGLMFFATFIAFTLIKFGLRTPAWLRDVDASNSPYFQRTRNNRKNEWFPTYEDLFKSMGLWEVKAFGNDLYHLPVRDYELKMGSTALILSCVCGFLVYVTFTFQRLMRWADYTKVLFLMVVSLWFSALMFIFSIFGTSCCFWYFRREIRYQRYGYSHNCAWIGVGFSLLAFVLAIIRFIVHKQALEKLNSKKNKYKPETTLAQDEESAGTLTVKVQSQQPQDLPR